MVSTTSTGFHLDEDMRKEQIVASLRGFLKHQTAFKEYSAKRMTPEEYTTICSIVTEGFVELSIEILALEAHLGGPNHVIPVNAPTAPIADTVEGTTTDATAGPTTSSLQSMSLNSPEHAQLIREVQLLEKQKLALTVQGQKWVLEMEAQRAQDQKDREAEEQADRVMNNEDTEVGGGACKNGSEVQTTAAHESTGQASSQVNGGPKLSVEEWQAKLEENRASLNQIIEDINDNLADIQEAIAVLLL
ncbi:hypothetical protein BGZ70_005330 [Mortierella alpina]|uniref:Uncharacterized protein n=1 Tax=Mortierella alpina TaxID=64518 RepID=A0A9P6M4A3_MORAP|nr:hypothetical protein BGZ70_005330 [Mortierella alpina]